MALPYVIMPYPSHDHQHPPASGDQVHRDLWPGVLAWKLLAPTEAMALTPSNSHLNWKIDDLN